MLATRLITAYQSSIITSGLVLYLDAGNTSSYAGSGTTWTDLSGLGNNGTLVNGPTYSSANQGSILFDGTNDYVTLGTPTSLNITGSITVNSWVNFSLLPTGSNWSTIYEKGYSGTNDQTFLRYTSGALEFGTYSLSLGNKLTKYTVGSSVLVNNWCNIVGVFDQLKFTLYLNNTLVSQTAYVGSMFSSSAPIGIAAASISGTFQRFFKGNISVVQAYNRALTAAEVSQNFNAVKGRYGL
jgi:hypothetical protein